MFTAWLIHSYFSAFMKLMDEFRDVNSGEKAVMKLWNKFVNDSFARSLPHIFHLSINVHVCEVLMFRIVDCLNSNILGADSRLCQACEAFIRTYSKTLM